MEIIINQIRNVLDDMLGAKGFVFNDRSNSYQAQLAKEKGLFYGYYFDLRKKIGGDYFLLDISLRIQHKQVSGIVNDIKITAINERKGIPASLKKSLLKDVKTNETIAGVYNWLEIEAVFQKEVTIWSCSIYDLTELANYESQLLSMVNEGQKWAEKAKDWQFLIEWALNHNNALQGLSILKYLGLKDQFEIEKKRAIDDYQKRKYPIDELNLMSW